MRVVTVTAAAKPSPMAPLVTTATVGSSASQGAGWTHGTPSRSPIARPDASVARSKYPAATRNAAALRSVRFHRSAGPGDMPHHGISDGARFPKRRASTAATGAGRAAAWSHVFFGAPLRDEPTG